MAGVNRKVTIYGDLNLPETWIVAQRAYALFMRHPEDHEHGSVFSWLDNAFPPVVVDRQKTGIRLIVQNGARYDFTPEPEPQPAPEKG